MTKTHQISGKMYMVIAFFLDRIKVSFCVFLLTFHHFNHVWISHKEKSGVKHKYLPAVICLCCGSVQKKKKHPVMFRNDNLLLIDRDTLQM